MPDLFTKSTATLSDCGRYRYALTRIWDPTKPAIAWCMINPSTADAEQDDPTIRRVIGFSRTWGSGGIVVNLFAFRSTDPAALYDEEGPDPIASPDDTAPFYPNRNDAEIIKGSDGRRLIAAWGCHGAHLGRDRAVMKLLAGRFVECLGTTKEGHPKHPLYLAGESVPEPFEMPEVAGA